MKTAQPMISPSERQKLLRSLAACPSRIALLSQGLDDVRLKSRPSDSVWSANDILAHLRSCADVWGKSIQAMIAEDHPTMPYVSPRTWIRKTNYGELAFRDSLHTFTQQRSELLKTLKALKPPDWYRGATFTATAKRREQTVLSYAQRIADHEQAHCEQLAALLNSGKV